MPTERREMSIDERLRHIEAAVEIAEQNITAARRRLTALREEISSHVDQSGQEPNSELGVEKPEPLQLDEIWPDLSTISKAAQTRRAEPLSRDMDPRKLGYLEAMFASSFPDVKYDRVLEQFLSWYISKGDTSRNWFEKFLSYAQGAQDRATVGGRGATDSMGMPTDPKKRRRFLRPD